MFNAVNLKFYCLYIEQVTIKKKFTKINFNLDEFTIE